MKICSLDQSLTGTALIIFDLNTEEIEYFTVLKTINRDKKTKEVFSKEHRIKSIIDKVIEIIHEYECEYVFLEGLSLKSKNSVSARDLAGLYYSLLITFINNQIQYEVFSPLTVKAFAIGGKAKKTEMFDKLPKEIKEKFIKKGYKKTTGLLDLSDSYYIGKLGISTLKEKFEEGKI